MGAPIHIDLDVASCYPAAFHNYTVLLEKISEAVCGLKICTSERNITFDSTLFPIFPDMRNCYFFPDLSWTSQDVLVWFALLGFTPASPAAGFCNKLSGQLLLCLDALTILTEDDWTLPLQKYSAYCKWLQVYWPGLIVKELRKIQKKAELA